MKKDFSTSDYMLALQALFAIAKRTRADEDREKFFGALFEVYSLKALAIASAKNTSFAEDIVQEIFIKFMTANLSKFPDFINENFDFYFIRSCINHCRTFHRLNHRKNSFQELNPLYHDSCNSSTNEFTELSHDLQYFISLLPDNQQNILYLKIEGFSYDEIVELLQIDKTRVRNHLQRGRKKLRQLIEKEENFDHLEHRKSA